MSQKILNMNKNAIEKDSNAHLLINNAAKPSGDEMDEKTRQEFLKALTSYASHFYSNLSTLNSILKRQ